MGRIAGVSLHPTARNLELIFEVGTNKPRATRRYYQTLMKIASNLIRSGWVLGEGRIELWGMKAKRGKN